MRIKRIFCFLILCALGVFASDALPVSACEPQGESLANRATDPTCRLVLPAARVAPSPRAVLASVSGVVLGAADYTTSPNCFLPDASSMTSVTGIGEGCPPPFLPPRATPQPPRATATPTVVAKATPKGDSFHSAREVTGNWETVAPGASIWHRVDNSGNSRLDVWMDTYGKSGIGFVVYSEEQMKGFDGKTPPKGRGAPNKSDPSHDLSWGGSPARGLWYVVVPNTNPTPMQYRIGTKGRFEEKICTSYWEWIGTSYVYWTACH